MEPNVAKAMRMLEEWDKEKERRGAVTAGEMGFSSWAECKKHIMQVHHPAHLEYEKKMDEKAALLGKTREEMDMEDPQGFIPDEAYTPECDCKEHPIPFFCPKSLVDYQSQDVAEQMDYLARQKRIRIEDLKIDQGDTSRRLDQGVLEKAWVLQSQNDLRNIPYWAKADPVVRQILDSTSHSPLVQPRHSANRLPRPTSPSSDDLTMAESGRTTTIAYKSPRLTDENRHVQTPSWKDSPRNHVPGGQTNPQKHPKSKYSPNPRSKRKSRTNAITPSGKTKVHITSKIQKKVPKPAMGTRSCNINYFYELGLKGIATRQRKSPR